MCCRGQDCTSVLLYMMHSNNNNNIIIIYMQGVWFFHGHIGDALSSIITYFIICQYAIYITHDSYI